MAFPARPKSTESIVRSVSKGERFRLCRYAGQRNHDRGAARRAEPSDAAQRRRDSGYTNILASAIGTTAQPQGCVVRSGLKGERFRLSQTLGSATVTAAQPTGLNHSIQLKGERFRLWHILAARGTTAQPARLCCTIWLKGERFRLSHTLGSATVTATQPAGLSHSIKLKGERFRLWISAHVLGRELLLLWGFGFFARPSL